MASRKGSQQLLCLWTGEWHTDQGKRIIPLPVAFITLDRALGFGPCNDAGNTWENWRELLEGPKAVGARVLGIWAEVGGAGLLHPGEEITLGAPNSPSVPLRDHQGDRTRFLIVVQHGRMRHKCPCMELESFRLDLRKSFFILRTVWKLGRFNRVVVQYPSFSRSNWTTLWEVLSDATAYPALSRGVNQVTSSSSF